VTGFVHSQELQVLVLLQLTSGLAVNKPILVLSLLELSLTGPGDSIGPSLTTSPVAHEVLISGVHEDAETSLKHSLNLTGEVVKPVTSESGMNQLAAFYPLAASYSQLGLNIGIVEETVGVAHVVAEGRHVALLADIVHIEYG